MERLEVARPNALWYATSVVTKTLLQDIEQKLRERQRQLEEELRQFATRNPRAPGGWQTSYVDVGRSEDENATEVAMYSDSLSLERTLETALRDVASALARIEAGTYGTCRYCAKPIDEKRLLARPTSSACVACKVEKKKTV